MNPKLEESLKSPLPLWERARERGDLLLFLVPKLQLGNAIAGKAPALSRRSGASCSIYVPKLELGNEM